MRFTDMSLSGNASIGARRRAPEAGNAAEESRPAASGQARRVPDAGQAPECGSPPVRLVPPPKDEAKEERSGIRGPE